MESPRSQYWYPTIIVVILAMTSLCVAYVVFHFLDSSASIKGTTFQFGGAIAGFFGAFYLFKSTLSSLSKPILTSNQTLVLIQYFQEALIGRIMVRVYDILEDTEAGRKPPSNEEMANIVRGIQHRMRQDLWIFDTPIGRLNKRMEEAFDPFIEEDVTEGMKLLLSELPAGTKLRKTADVAYRRADSLRSMYLKDLEAANWPLKLKNGHAQ